MQNSKVDRREFTRLSLLSMLSGVAITVTACGGSSGAPGAPAPPPDGSKAGSISANHGHSVTNSSAQLAAGGALVLTLQGTTGVPAHTHTVELTGAEVVSIRDGARISKDSSSSDGHTHIVTFN